MSTPTWPSGLPDHPLIGLKRAPEPNVVRFEVSGGPAKVRRRGTKKPVLLLTPFEITGAELALLKTFFEDTLQDGSLSFTWEGFTDDAENLEVRFLREPAVTLRIPAPDPNDRIYDCTLELEEV